MLVMIVVALFALFWGAGMLAQGYLYNQPADRFALRAAAAALLVGIFLTAWCWIDRRSPGRYDTFFEFAPYDTRPFDEFEAVRWIADPAAAVKGKTEFKKGEDGQPIEKVTKFRRPGGGKSGAFAEEGTGNPFELSGTPKGGGPSTLTVALLVRPEPGADPIRLKAALKKDDRIGALTYAPGPERRFTEESGSRYVKADQMGVLYAPTSGVVVLALLLNLAHFVVWFLAFWLVMHFRWSHALGFATAFGLLTMLLVIPLLFKQVRKPAAPPPPEKTELRAPAEPRDYARGLRPGGACDGSQG
jgi:hypothetical protein